ncbi:MAG: hypothetical protein HRT90_01865, partial [Candidatus Margulisbacteria bacterium]|nr:hypothetical protein [Candidatus Margulisiibacteriota bacterium]
MPDSSRIRFKIDSGTKLVIEQSSSAGKWIDASDNLFAADTCLNIFEYCASHWQPPQSQQQPHPPPQQQSNSSGSNVQKIDENSIQHTFNDSITRADELYRIFFDILRADKNEPEDWAEKTMEGKIYNDSVTITYYYRSKHTAIEIVVNKTNNKLPIHRLSLSKDKNIIFSWERNYYDKSLNPEIKGFIVVNSEVENIVKRLWTEQIMLLFKFLCTDSIETPLATPLHQTQPQQHHHEPPEKKSKVSPLNSQKMFLAFKPVLKMLVSKYKLPKKEKCIDFNDCKHHKALKANYVSWNIASSISHMHKFNHKRKWCKDTGIVHKCPPIIRYFQRKAKPEDIRHILAFEHYENEFEKCNEIAPTIKKFLGSLIPNLSDHYIIVYHIEVKSKDAKENKMKRCSFEIYRNQDDAVIINFEQEMNGLFMNSKGQYYVMFRGSIPIEDAVNSPSGYGEEVSVKMSQPGRDRWFTMMELLIRVLSGHIILKKEEQPNKQVRFSGRNWRAEECGKNEHLRAMAQPTFIAMDMADRVPIKAAESDEMKSSVPIFNPNDIDFSEKIINEYSKNNSNTKEENTNSFFEFLELSGINVSTLEVFRQGFRFQFKEKLGILKKKGSVVENFLRVLSTLYCCEESVFSYTEKELLNFDLEQEQEQ